MPNRTVAILRLENRRGSMTSSTAPRHAWRRPSLSSRPATAVSPRADPSARIGGFEPPATYRQVRQ